jgi:hypothetical protein
MQGVNKNPTTAELRTFGLTMLLGFAAIGAIVAWRVGLGTAAYVLWGLGAFFLIVELAAAPSIGKSAYIVWMSIAVAIGKVMIPVFLTILYFTLLIPFTLIRLKDPLRFKRGAESYWEPHKNHEPTIERMMRPF